MHAFFKLFIMLISSGRQKDKLLLCSEVFFCFNPVPNVYSTTSVDVLLELLLLTRNPSLLVLKIYGKANFLKMFIDVDHDNLRTVLLQTPNIPPILIHFRNPESPFPTLHVIFEKSFNYDTKFVYFLAKTFSSCYLCCFWLKNVVSTSN